MNRGEESIYNRPGSSVLWFACYLRGKLYRESTKTEDERKAKNFLKARLKEVHAAEIGARPFIGPQEQKITISAILDGMEADYRLRNKWIARRFPAHQRAQSHRRPRACRDEDHRTPDRFDVRRYAIVDESQKRDALARTQAYLAAVPAERKVIRMKAAGEES